MPQAKRRGSLGDVSVARTFWDGLPSPAVGARPCKVATAISCLPRAFLSRSSTPHPSHTRLQLSSSHDPQNSVYWHYQAFLTLRRLRSNQKLPTKRVLSRPISSWTRLWHRTRRAWPRSREQRRPSPDAPVHDPRRRPKPKPHGRYQPLVLKISHTLVSFGGPHQLAPTTSSAGPATVSSTDGRKKTCPHMNISHIHPAVASRSSLPSASAMVTQAGLKKTPQATS
jgi:hypothetical protein